jgi:hypothetical protein
MKIFDSKVELNCYMPMCKIYSVTVALMIGFLLIASCKLSGDPEIINSTAVNEGKDLKIEWKKVQNAEGYKLYCDGAEIGNIKETSYIIPGPWYYCNFFGCRKGGFTCKTVEVLAYSSLGGDKRTASLNLTPKFVRIDGLVSHDTEGNSWVKIDFLTGEIKAVPEYEANPNIPNTAWFVFYNNSGNPEFRDAEEVGKVANVRVKFSDKFNENTVPNLAPDPESYSTKITVPSTGKIYFWIDSKGTGYVSVDSSDYFGAILVKSLIEGNTPGIYRGEGPYKVDLEILLQDKVKGLRWVKW